MLENLYEGCGLLASFLGTFIEGEVLLLTAVVSAKLGMFNYFWGMVAAFFGAYTKDWLKFLVIKKHGNKLLEKKPKLKTKIDKSSLWFEKRPYLIMSIYRLMYGMSTVILLMAGLKDMSYLRFGIHSAISVALWVTIVGGIGYFCAESMINGIHNLSAYKWHIIGSMVIIGLGVWYFKHRPHDKFCLTPNNETA